MRAHYLQHVPFEGLGSMSAWLTARGAHVTSTRLFEAAAFPELESIDCLIVLGGPMSVNDERTLPWLVPEKKYVERALSAGKSVLGVCLGAQLIANVSGARVFPNQEREIGWHTVEPVSTALQTPFGKIFSEPVQAFHWHGETFDLPKGATHLARSKACEHQAFALGARVLGLQFHLETTLDAARALIENCRDELTPAPWVQSEQEMLAVPSRFQEANQLMARILECLDPPNS